MLGQGILSGKKTYVVSITGALAAIGAYLTGDIGLADLIQSLIVAVSTATLRAGVQKAENAASRR